MLLHLQQRSKGFHLQQRSKFITVFTYLYLLLESFSNTLPTCSTPLMEFSPSLIEVPVVILIYSFFRKDKNQSWYLKAVARGLLALPLGAIINALGAIVLGAPVGPQYFQRTLNWSLLMSAFTFVPAACVYGTSWVDWQHALVHTKPNGFVDYMISLPAHGAVIGSWFGAWPMPLDWERTWQEWPICVSYGGIFGYFAGMLVSICFVVYRVSCQHRKGD